MRHGLYRTLLGHGPMLALALFVLLALPAPAALAQPLPSLSFSLPQAPSGHVTVLVLDMSGSMGDNDPDGLRCSAANAYIDLSGPGDFIGVVGLDNAGRSGGPHGYGPAQVWAQPAEMATVANRQHLKDTIKAKSDSCRPDASTPTYDALKQALLMLTKATADGKHDGSAILLTDGAPQPSSDGQISDTKSELLPQFKQHGFPVDTIALGADDRDHPFHPFLNDVANATSGKFYDDGKGTVPGVSPLNIAPFFVDIFARRNGRTVSQDIPPTQLGGGTASRNFSVGDFVSHLDVVVVKDSPDARVTITAPNGQVLPPAVAGTFISTDPHYAIFSIDHPQTGAWQVNVRGAGEFLMDSLKVSTLGLTITAPEAKATTLPIGQPLTITATLNDNGTPITGNRFSLVGTLIYGGGDAQYRQEFVLDDKASPGAYSTKVTVPAGGPTGAYQITVSVREVSDTIASANRSIRLERFPVPSFLSPKTGQPVSDTVPAAVIRWDPVLATIYGVPLGLITWLGGFALQGHPAQVAASVPGQVFLSGKPYAEATVQGQASLQGTSSSTPISVTNDSGGKFHVIFSAVKPGTYSVVLNTQGSFRDTHGDFGTVTRTVSVTISNATLQQEITAWVYTVAYLILFAALINLARTLVVTPAPYGVWERSTSRQGKTARAQSFRRTLRSPWQWFIHRNVLTSKQAFKTPGLLIRFRRGALIEVKADGPESQRWSSASGRIADAYAAHRVLTYRPMGADREGLDGEAETITYTISATVRGSAGGSGGSRSSVSKGSSRSTRTLGAKPAQKRKPGRGGRGGRAATGGPRGGGDSLFGGI